MTGRRWRWTALGRRRVEGGGVKRVLAHGEGRGRRVGDWEIWGWPLRPAIRLIANLIRSKSIWHIYPITKYLNPLIRKPIYNDYDGDRRGVGHEGAPGPVRPGPPPYGP